MDYLMLAQELLEILSDIPFKKKEEAMERSLTGQKFVLVYLAAHNGCAYPKAISESMMVSSARIAAILRNLEENGLIIRNPDPSDGRQIIVTLTDEGIRLAENHQKIMLENLTKMLMYLGPEDAQSYVRIRRKLLRMNSEGGAGL